MLSLSAVPKLFLLFRPGWEPKSTDVTAPSTHGAAKFVSRPLNHGIRSRTLTDSLWDRALFQGILELGRHL